MELFELQIVLVEEEGEVVLAISLGTFWSLSLIIGNRLFFFFFLFRVKYLIPTATGV